MYNYRNLECIRAVLGAIFCAVFERADCIIRIPVLTLELLLFIVHPVCHLPYASLLQGP
jgi:hypothetical protein